MSNHVQLKFAVHNLHGVDRNRKRRRKTIRMFLNACSGGFGGFNELGRADHRYIKREARRRHLRIFIHGEDGAVWHPAALHVGKPRVKKIMTGGHVGADGVHTPQPGDDDRRVGPNRYAIYLPCVVTALNLHWELVVTHTMAKSFTSLRWRIPLFRKSIRRLAHGVHSSDGIMIGDMNSKAYIDLPDVLDVPVITPPSFSGKHYDQIIRWGLNINVIAVADESTPSDHDMITGIAVFHQPERR